MQGKSIEDIRPWIVGPEGSNVTLAIKRGGNQLSGDYFIVFFHAVVASCCYPPSFIFRPHRKSSCPVQRHAGSQARGVCGGGSSKASVSRAARACVIAAAAALALPTGFCSRSSKLCALLKLFAGAGGGGGGGFLKKNFYFYKLA